MIAIPLNYLASQRPIITWITQFRATMVHSDGATQIQNTRPGASHRVERLDHRRRKSIPPHPRSAVCSARDNCVEFDTERLRGCGGGNRPLQAFGGSPLREPGPLWWVTLVTPIGPPALWTPLHPRV